MRFTEQLLDRFRAGWRRRVGRRKSLWHLPKILLGFALMGATWFMLFSGMWQVHVRFFPEHAGQLSAFWGEGISIRAFLSSFLLAIPLILPSIGIAFTIVNLVFWLIPPARERFESEAGDDIEMTFSGATSGLLRILIRYLIPIGFGLSMLGALTLSELK